MATVDPENLKLAYQRHPRTWQAHRYVYPVVSRRSRGVSIGINLNPDKACNFDCIYCQVDRTTPPVVRRVDLATVETELTALVELAVSGGLFGEPPFSHVPAVNRVIRDIAFSGDGEPTTCPQFLEAVEIAAAVRRRFDLQATKLVLITDAAYLKKPRVREGLALLDANNGEIWAKLDAGTDEYFQRVDRPNVSLDAVLDNILDAARVRPVVIQSMFLRIDGEGPSPDEIEAYCGRVNALVAAGGSIRGVQVYTVARVPAESNVSAIPDRELDALAAAIRGRISAPVDVFYGVG